jgi:hypothetical protein
MQKQCSRAPMPSLTVFNYILLSICSRQQNVLLSFPTLVVVVRAEWANIQYKEKHLPPPYQLPKDF